MWTTFLALTKQTTSFLAAIEQPGWTPSVEQTSQRATHDFVLGEALKLWQCWVKICGKQSSDDAFQNASLVP